MLPVPLRVAFSRSGFNSNHRLVSYGVRSPQTSSMFFPHVFLTSEKFSFFRFFFIYKESKFRADFLIFFSIYFFLKKKLKFLICCYFWQSTKAVEMKKDPYNHARWKHMWSWHNRGCVWDKVAADWSGDKDWTCETARCQTVEDEKRCVLFALQSVPWPFWIKNSAKFCLVSPFVDERVMGGS